VPLRDETFPLGPVGVFARAPYSAKAVFASVVPVLEAPAPPFSHAAIKAVRPSTINPVAHRDSFRTRNNSRTNRLCKPRYDRPLKVLSPVSWSQPRLRSLLRNSDVSKDAYAREKCVNQACCQCGYSGEREADLEKQAPDDAAHSITGRTGNTVLSELAVERGTSDTK
jgi:hypothetical protein